MRLCTKADYLKDSTFLGQYGFKSKNQKGVLQKFIKDSNLQMVDESGPRLFILDIFLHKRKTYIMSAFRVYVQRSP